MKRTAKKLTPWYPPEIKPVRVGVYERDTTGIFCGEFSHWDGEKWGGWGGTIGLANANSDTTSALQNVPWRGILKAPA